jgi:hypothetical protein
MTPNQLPEIWDNRNFMKIDSANNIYLSGNVLIQRSTVTFFIKYDNSGTLLWPIPEFSGNDSDYVSGDFTLRSSFDHGNIFVSGTTTNPDIYSVKHYHVEIFG